VATLVLTNFATVSIVKDDAASRFELFGAIWPIALTSAVAVILVMSFLYRSIVDLVEELEVREASAQHQALHDQLTGLANRALLEDRLSQALNRYRRSGEQVALLMLDLDRFKQVNDTLGHNAGDKLVQEVGDRLRSLLRDTDTVARIGGDEFAIVQVSPKGEADVRRLCERIISVIRKPFIIGDREARVGVSIGAVFASKEVAEASELLRKADITMYRAKAAGGNRFALADPDADARAITRHGLVNRLPTALERGEFFVEYQPLVRLADGTVRGAEALVRWCHPVHGTLGPDHFIPLAEATGLIVPLGRWVLEEAARQAHDWQFPGFDGPPLRVNVNLSPSQLHHPGLVPETVAALAAAGIEPSALCLEVTESALIGADEDLLRPLRQFAELGVDIALDDFGTGYSNLASLRQLPITTLKLDRSFTRGMQHQPVDPVDVKIVDGIVQLAHTLGLSVTVEGVETGLQAEHLRVLGCDTAQGWYYARPGPPERLHALSLVDASST
jgi:diguanylate cyclase (GGDEF)-like protein